MPSDFEEGQRGVDVLDEGALARARRRGPFVADDRFEIAQRGVGGVGVAVGAHEAVRRCPDAATGERRRAGDEIGALEHDHREPGRARRHRRRQPGRPGADHDDVEFLDGGFLDGGRRGCAHRRLNSSPRPARQPSGQEARQDCAAECGRPNADHAPRARAPGSGRQRGKRRRRLEMRELEPDAEMRAGAEAEMAAESARRISRRSGSWKTRGCDWPRRGSDACEVPSRTTTPPTSMSTAGTRPANCTGVT